MYSTLLMFFLLWVVSPLFAMEARLSAIRPHFNNQLRSLSQCSTVDDNHDFSFLKTHETAITDYNNAQEMQSPVADDEVKSEQPMEQFEVEEERNSKQAVLNQLYSIATMKTSEVPAKKKWRSASANNGKASPPPPGYQYILLKPGSPAYHSPLAKRLLPIRKTAKTV
jgi:hypothetical protein